MLESRIESACCSYATKAHGVKNLKLSGLIGIPDRLFMLNGLAMFIEFKQFGQTSRAIQKYVQSTLINNGFQVFEIDSVEDFKLILERWVNERRG